MSDKRRILEEAYGMPYVWLTTNDRKQIPITNAFGTIKTVNQFITKFKYKFDDEQGDECTIEIHIPKIEDFDNKAFVADNILRVKWGYIAPKGIIISSVERTIVVRDINPSYDDEKMCLELVCTSMLDYTKRMKSNHTSDTDTVFAFLKEVADGKFIPTVSVDGPLKLMHIDDAANTSYIHHGSGSKNLYSMMQKAIGIMPNGPYHIEGQDDKGIIHKRNWNQAPTAIFSYAGGNGELISFKPTSNVAKIDADNTETDFIDPSTKKMTKAAYTTAIQHGNNPSDVPEDAAKVMLDDYLAKAKWNAEHPLDQVEMPKDMVVRTDTENSSIEWLGTNAKKPFYMRPLAPKTEFVTSYNRYTLNAVLQSPYANALQRQRLIENFVKKKLERKFEATAEILGDPSLVNRKIYNFQGLSKQDSGDWYCNTAEHNITATDGYKTTLGLMRKPILLDTIYESREKTFAEEFSNVQPLQETRTERYEKPVGKQAREEQAKVDAISNSAVGKALNSLGTQTWSSVEGMKTRIKDQTIQEELFRKQLSQEPEFQDGLAFLERPNGKQVINSSQA